MLKVEDCKNDWTRCRVGIEVETKMKSLSALCFVLILRLL